MTNNKILEAAVFYAAQSSGLLIDQVSMTVTGPVTLENLTLLYKIAKQQAIKDYIAKQVADTCDSVKDADGPVGFVGDSPIFISRGDEPEEYPTCPTCHGSGAADEQQAPVNAELLAALKMIYEYHTTSEPLNSVSGYRDSASRVAWMGVLREKAQALLDANAEKS